MTSANLEQSNYIIGSASQQIVSNEVYQQRMTTLQELNKSLLESNRNYLAQLATANARLAEGNQNIRALQRGLKLVTGERNQLSREEEQNVKLLQKRDNTIESYNRNSCENALIHKKLRDSHNNQTDKMQCLIVNHDALLQKHRLLSRQIKSLQHIGTVQEKVSMGIAKILMFIFTQQSNIRNRLSYPRLEKHS